jgi:hypothetical protein
MNMLYIFHRLLEAINHSDWQLDITSLYAQVLYLLINTNIRLDLLLYGRIQIGGVRERKAEKDICIQ